MCEEELGGRWRVVAAVVGRRRCREEKGNVSLAVGLIIRSTTKCATERDHMGLCSREPNFIVFSAHAQRYRVYKYKLPLYGRRLLL